MVPKKETRREHILTTTRRLILENGLQATSMNRISKESGVPMGSIYSLFPSKEILVNTLYRECRDCLFQGFLTASPSELSPQDSFKAVLRQYINTAMAHKEMFLFVAQYNLSPVISEDDRIEHDLQFGSKKISELIELGAFRKMDYLIIDALILGAINKILSLHFTGHILLTERMIEDTLDACWRAVSNDAYC